MEIKTKFDLGQRVFIIHKGGESIKVECEACSGKGGLTIDNNYFECTNCYGRGITDKWMPKSWKIIQDNGKIGKIGAELYRDKFKPLYNDRIYYMIDETGVGSGSLWKEEDIFATEKEALDECQKRNDTDSLVIAE